MKYKEFKRLPGDKLPVIGFGCWSIGGEWNNIQDSESIAAIRTAIDLGITFFDTAPVYGKGHSELILGKAIKEVKRDKLFIASKCGLVWDENLHVDVNLSRRSLKDEIDRSLERLGVSYLDLWQCHWPDPDTSLQETMEALAEIRDEGKIRYIGLSNYSYSDLEVADSFGVVSSFQGLYNMLEHNPSSYHNIPLTYKTKDEILPYCEKHGMMYLPYSPLFQGLLAGNFKAKENFDEHDKRAENPKLLGDSLAYLLRVVDDLKDFARKIDKPLAQLAINWLVNQPSVGPVIAGLNKKEHALSTVGALSWELTEEMEAEIDSILNTYELE
ncbi:MAG: aldo/keto reductase [Bacteroidota bacterium]